QSPTPPPNPVISVPRGVRFRCQRASRSRTYLVNPDPCEYHWAANGEREVIAQSKASEETEPESNLGSLRLGLLAARLDRQAQLVEHGAQLVRHLKQTLRYGNLLHLPAVRTHARLVPRLLHVRVGQIPSNRLRRRAGSRGRSSSSSSSTSTRTRRSR